MTEPAFLPYCRHVVEDDDIAAVTAVLRGDALTQGPAVAGFESDLAQVVQASHAVVCANGTAALHLAALALGLQPGDAVLVPAQTFAATANCIRYVGADVVFTDVCPDTGLMRPQDLNAALHAHPGRRFRAAFPVHLNGQAVDMAGLADVAQRAGLVLVEDACHALGTIIDADGPVGNCRHSAMTVFSFHPAKTIAMGEGGAITTNDAALAKKLALLRNHGITRDPADFQHEDAAFDGEGHPNPWYYEMVELGFNYRACDIQCALGRSQLAKLPRFAAIRRQLVQDYADLLAPLAPLVRPVAKLPNQQPVWHLAAVRIDFEQAGKPRAQVMAELRAQGIGTQVNYIPVPRQPYYTRIAQKGAHGFPGADRYYQHCLSLPLSAAMSKTDVARVVDRLKFVLETS